MEPFEDYLKKKVNYERKTIRRYLHDLDTKYIDGTREDINEFFDSIDEHFKNLHIPYTPKYEMDYDFDGYDDDREYYAIMYVFYERPETDDEMKSRIESEEKCALRSYQRLEDQEEMEKVRLQRKEAEERALYEELKKKFG